MDDTEQLIALVHACGLRRGRDPDARREECPFCGGRVDLCEAWLAGFSLGCLTRPAASGDRPAPSEPPR